MKVVKISLSLGVLLASIFFIYLGINCFWDKKDKDEVITDSSGSSVPTPPSALNVTVISSSQIDLTWTDNSNDEEGFKIESRQGGTTEYSLLATVGPNVTSYSNTGLTDGAICYYRICAYNTYGNSTYSNEASTAIPLNAPTNLIANPVSSSQINLTWYDNSNNESGFKIERKTLATEHSLLATVGPNVTSYSDTVLTEMTTYHYRLKAYNATNDSSYSEEISATTMALIGLTKSAKPMFQSDLRHTGLSEYSGPNTPNVIWNFTAASGCIFASPVVDANDIIYIGFLDGNLYALNPVGHLMWTFQTGDEIDATATIGNGQTIHVGSFNGTFYAINPNGTLKWKFFTSTNEKIESSSVIGPDGTIYFGTKDEVSPGPFIYGCFYALNPDGALKWKFNCISSTSSSIVSSPAIDPDGTIYFGNIDNDVYALNPDGSVRWRYCADPAESAFQSSPLIAPDGTIYIGNASGKLHAITPNGERKWVYDIQTVGLFGIKATPAIAKDGTIYFTGYTMSDYSGKIFALNPTGSLKWSYSIGDDEPLSSAAVGSNGIIYVGSSTYSAPTKIYAFNPDGSLKWSYLTDCWYIWPSPAILSNGMVVIGGDSGKIYALKD